MFEPAEQPTRDIALLNSIYGRAPAGALAVAGVAVGLVFTLWFLFYLCVFLPRGILR